HEAFAVHVDTMLALRPFVAGTLTAPALDVVAGGVEHDYRGRALRHIFRFDQGARAVQRPDVILRVDRKAGHVAELPLRGNLRPVAIDLERRQAARADGADSARLLPSRERRVDVSLLQDLLEIRTHAQVRDVIRDRREPMRHAFRNDDDVADVDYPAAVADHRAVARRAVEDRRHFTFGGRSPAVDDC